MEKAQNNGGQLSSVKNALQILQCFTMEKPEQRVGEIAQALDLNKSSVSRTIATLASEGFLVKDPETNKFRLGLTIVTLSGVVYNSLDLYQESIPVLKKLVENCGETAHISILDNDSVIYLQKVECNHPVQFLTHIGRRNPPHGTSSGKVLLAYSDPSISASYIAKGLKYYTSQTITDPAIFQEHLAEIRVSGYAESYDEIFEGVNSIAAPIFNFKGKIVAALSVVGPKQRMNSSKMKAIAQQTVRASKEISALLGYRAQH